MKIINQTIKLATRGNPDLIDVTGELVSLLDSSGLKKGTLTAFIIGSTAAITTFEYEPGLIKDVRDLYDRLIPQNTHYRHDETWGDANGFSHLRALLQGPSLSIPFDHGRLFLGAWQQVVLAEFDNRPRDRQIAVQIMGE